MRGRRRKERGRDGGSGRGEGERRGENERPGGVERRFALKRDRERDSFRPCDLFGTESGAACNDRVVRRRQGERQEAR